LIVRAIHKLGVQEVLVLLWQTGPVICQLCLESRGQTCLLFFIIWGPIQSNRTKLENDDPYVYFTTDLIDIFIIWWLLTGKLVFYWTWYQKSHHRIKKIWVRVMVFNITFNNISVTSWQCFIAGGNRSTLRKPLTCRKSLRKLYNYNPYIFYSMMRFLVTGSIKNKFPS
jgi:hypothetical protein